MKPLPPKYEHQAAESKWQQQWLEAGVYSWDEDATLSRDQQYVIDTPPPTVSGLLHMGHIFSYTQADFVARFWRMMGKNVFYPMGFDDNGLPTERLVEKNKKIRATDMSREAFIALCDEVTQEARAEFRALFQSVALSVDWKWEYHTISEESRTLSQMSFLDLLQKNKAYRKLQPMIWDPVDQTAIAQAEIEDKEHSSFMHHIHFGVAGEQAPVTIATTRPELIGACVAVFYHPDDARYQHLAGKSAMTALFGVKVPFLADDKVMPEKGTGLVMCCTFGDETDIHWWQTHKLPMRILLNRYGKIDFSVSEDQQKLHFTFSEAGDERASLTAANTQDLAKAIALLSEIKGKKAKDARDWVVAQITEAGLLVKSDPITHAVKCAERSGAALEIIPTHQWFVQVLSEKEALKKKAAECNWNPDFMRVRIEQWIDGLNWDWCISRQRYYGVPFPIWYSKRAGEEGKILVPELDQLPVNPLVDLPRGYSREEVEAESDVMDTWATSSISPQLSSKAITKDFALNYDRHQRLFPADLRPQAHEIIRTWAFYTIVKAHLHEDSIPWQNLMISGWCLAVDKTKMSKSKGNVVTPIDLIQNHGADVVRYWASTSHLGADTAYSEEVLRIGKKLINKLWNASKFATLHLDKLAKTPTTVKQDCDSGVITETIDLWVLSRLSKTIAKATKAFEIFEYCRAREAIEDFFWNDFCDNYLELVKARSYGEESDISKQAQQSAIVTLYHCVETFLRLFAPFVPHITEELYSHLFDERYRASGSVHSKQRWPNLADYVVREEEEKLGILAVELLNLVRKAKADQSRSIKWPLEQLVICENQGQGVVASALEHIALDLKHVTNSIVMPVVAAAGKGTVAGDKVESDDKALCIYVMFAEESDAA